MSKTLVIDTLLSVRNTLKLQLNKNIKYEIFINEDENTQDGPRIEIIFDLKDLWLLSTVDWRNSARQLRPFEFVPREFKEVNLLTKKIECFEKFINFLNIAYEYHEFEKNLGK